MKYRSIILILFTLLTLAAYGQSSVSIKGQVIDENNDAVPFANAALYSSTDSSLITGAVSDEDGYFSIEAKPGNYILRITFLSYEEKSIAISLGNEDKNLGRIQLKSGAQILESITVEGERSQMELHLDKRVFTVGKDISSISGSASEVLDNVPSITVDVEGNVSLRGSQNVRILIDGRPSGLTGISTADALNQLQGNLIERIEVITNPSARYDAEGEVGIINIILKKENRKGINGSFSANAGHPDNYGASFSLNIRRKNFNFFPSYGINYRSNPGRGFSYQRFDPVGDDPDAEPFSYRQNTKRTRSGISHNFRFGLDYFIDDRNILTGSFLLRRSDGLNKTRNEYLDYDANDILTRSVYRNEREEEPETNSEIALSYRREYQKKGQLLTADFKWIENRETENSTYEQFILQQDSLINEKSLNTENERNALVQVDYVHPFGKSGRIEAGLKSTLRVIDNKFRVERLDQETNIWSPLTSFNNHLIYTENIHAGYFIVSNEFGNFSWQAGLRGELSDINVELKGDNQKTYQNYFNVFPSVHLGYKLSPEKSVQLSYSYRLSRPWFRDLMPFSNYSDNRSISLGNPNLKPEYTNSIEAGYLLNFETGSLLSSVYYRYKTGVFERIQVVDSTGFTSRQSVNLGTQDAYGFEFNFTWNPKKWFRFNSNANLYRAITEGSYGDTEFYADTYTWTNRTTSRFTIAKAVDLQASFNYRAPRITPQGENRAMYFFDAGMSRDILKGNGTVTFGVRDVFNTRKFRGITTRPEEGYYSESESQGRPRQFLLTLTYRLNMRKESQREGRRDNSGMNDGGGDVDFGE